MARVCYTQVGSCEFQIFTLAAGNSCVCVHFPQAASRISSRCQLHFPVANCILPFTPSQFLPPQTTIPGPETFLLSARDCSKLRQREDPHIFEPVDSARRCWGKLLPSYLRTNHPSWSSSAPLVLLHLQLFMSNLNSSNFNAWGREILWVSV